MQLEELSITGEQSNDNWHVGLDCIPEEWAALTRLSKLELRGHSLLNVSSPSCSQKFKNLSCRLMSKDLKKCSHVCQSWLLML